MPIDNYDDSLEEGEGDAIGFGFPFLGGAAYGIAAGASIIADQLNKAGAGIAVEAGIGSVGRMANTFGVDKIA